MNLNFVSLSFQLHTSIHTFLVTASLLTSNLVSASREAERGPSLNPDQYVPNILLFFGDKGRGNRPKDIKSTCSTLFKQVWGTYGTPTGCTTKLPVTVVGTDHDHRLDSVSSHSTSTFILID